jgi:hypothetical protein
METITITGDKRIDRKLKRLAGSAQRRIARAGLAKQMTNLSRGIRNAIPPDQKSAKKTIGRKNKKNPKTGQHEAKVGLGVGKRTKSTKQRDPKKGGKGISKENIHWLVLGSKERRTKSGRSTGKMPRAPEDWVKNGVRATQAEATKAMKDVMKLKILEEAAKG